MAELLIIDICVKESKIMGDTKDPTRKSTSNMKTIYIVCIYIHYSLFMYFFISFCVCCKVNLTTKLISSSKFKI